MKLKRYDYEIIDDKHLKIKRDYLTYLLSEIHKLNKINDKLEEYIKKKNKQINDIEKYYKDKIIELKEEGKE